MMIQCQRFYLPFLLLFIVTINFSQHTYAQSKLDGLGIKSGYNLSFFANNPDDLPRHRFNLGFSYRLKLLNKFYFVPELLFHARGARSSGLPFNIVIKNNILSLDTPFLFRYTFARKQGWIFSSGPNMSFAFKSSATLTQDNESKNIDLDDMTNIVTFGWIADIGYKFKVFEKSFVISSRFKKDLSAQFENSDGLKNNIFSLMLSLEF